MNTAEKRRVARANPEQPSANDGRGELVTDENGRTWQLYRHPRAAFSELCSRGIAPRRDDGARHTWESWAATRTDAAGNFIPLRLQHPPNR